MDIEWRQYRSSHPILWWLLTGFCAGLGAMNIGLSIYFGVPFWMPLMIAGVSFAPALLIAFETAFLPILVSPLGLRCPNSWGKYSLAPWNSITSVSRHNLLGLNYLQVVSATCQRRLRVPLYLSDMVGFASYVRQHTGEENPLVAALD